jgi:diaminohydroxyphosphoribosylaminopyrimidine deaminase/5-amino-6-(5-phosphoribosylamino)uracil reductase
MSKKEDIKYMKRAIELSLLGHGHVSPNPLVGAVIVKNGKIIGEGYHKKSGEAHAEVNAIESATESVAGATMYVTLEPCNHFGKTPPCTERIIREKISRVVLGISDPNKNVSGGGIEKLITAGIEVGSGVLQNEIRKVNEVFIKYVQTGQPFCAMKTAMTMDGKISTYTGDSKWISNELSRKFVHELRHSYSGIMVGVNTVISDNPFLTDRSDHENKSHPAKIVVDSNGRTPLDSNIFKSNEARTIIAVTEKASQSFVKKATKMGVEIIFCPVKNNKIDIRFLLTHLGELGIDSVLLEGGSTLNFSALQDAVVDKVYSFISPKLIGGEKAHTPVGGAGFKKINDAIVLKISEIKRFEEDIMIEAYIN